MKNRFPFCRQFDSMQCGIACMSMIAAYYGQRYSLRFLEQFCDVTREGISLKALHDMAHRIGMQAMSGKLTEAKLATCPLPAILHWNQNHFVVLYRIKNDKYYIADPAKGKRRIQREEFAEKWLSYDCMEEKKGVALFLEPNEQFGKLADSIGQPRQSWKDIIHRFIEYRFLFLRIILCLLVVTGIQLVFPFLTQAIVDKGVEKKDIGFIWLILMGELALVIGRTISDFIRNRTVMKMSLDINLSMVSGFFLHLLKLPMSFFDTRLVGDLLERMGDHQRIQNFITADFLNMALSCLSFIIFGVVLAYYNIIVFLVFLTGCLLYSGWIALFLRKRKDLDYEYFDRSSVCQGRTVEFISAIQEIKLQGCEIKRRTEWEKAQRNLHEIKYQMLRLQQMQEAGCIFINETKNIIITILTAAAVIKGGMTLGMMLSVQYIIGQLNSPVEQLVRFVYALQSVKISLERIDEIESKEMEENSEEFQEIPKDSESIKLSNIIFKYDRSSTKKILNDVSVTFPAGKVTAIVGASGSGKTTLLKLILGYYPILEGSISVGNIPLQNLKIKKWRALCGVVMQESIIFTDSIAGNIAVGDVNIDMDRVMNAARIACIDDFIQSLPLKYNTRIGVNGIGLSSGQKQRILIARAVYRNPRYIILDEATNSLDAKNERMIVENMSRFYDGKTVIIVAHRLSTVKHADQIIVLKDGMVAEMGTHKTLASLKGDYYQLVKNQLELDNQST